VGSETGKSSLNRNKDLSDELFLGRYFRVIHVILNAPVVAHPDFFPGDILVKDITASLRQVRIGPRQDKTRVLATLEFPIFHALRQGFGLCGDRYPRAIGHLGLELIKARVSRDFIFPQYRGNQLVQAVPGRGGRFLPECVGVLGGLL